MTSSLVIARARRHPGAIAAALALLAISASIPGASVVLLAATLDRVLGDRDAAALLPVCLGFAGLYALRGAVLVARTRITKGLAWEVAAELRAALHGRLLALPPDETPLGARLASLTNEVDEVQYGVSAWVTALRNPLTLTGLAATAAWLAPGLALLALVLIPAIAATAWWTGRRVRDRADAARRSRADLVALAADQLAAHEAIDERGAAGDETARFAGANARDRDDRIGLEVTRVWPSALTQAVAALAAAALLWVGGHAVLAGALEPGRLVGFAVALGLMHAPIGGLSEVWALWQRCQAALVRVEQTLSRLPPADPAEPVELPDGPLALSWEGVVAGWGDADVLRGVDLRVAPGEHVAITGPSGAGKSTLLALAAGRLAPRQGTVRVANVPLDQLRPADRRRAIALVPQRILLLDRTVRENVALGRPDATDAEIRAALVAAGAGFVDALPGGLDAPVGEAGTRLSGGERQRLCIARALLGRPAILLLDEGTSQVDGPTERAILGDLRANAPEIAIVSVSHDPATTALADRIVALAGGVARGTARAVA